MNARIVGQLGVKGSSETLTLPNQYGIVALPGENFNAGSDLGDFRRADEDHFEGSASGFDGGYCG